MVSTNTSPVFRIFVEKKEEFAVESGALFDDLSKNLQIEGLQKVRIFNCYDLQGITQDVFDQAKNTIFSEPQVDLTYIALPKVDLPHKVFAVEYLPGQFDQRADSLEQCIGILTQQDRPKAKSSRVFLLVGDISDKDFDRIKSYIINPVESREASFEKPETLIDSYEIPTEVETLRGFIKLDQNGLKDFIGEYGLAMDLDDIIFCQQYFKEAEKRDPTITEIKMIDTYWSDHCRHTTFLTNITNAEIEPAYIKEAYDLYIRSRELLSSGKNKPISLMDIATIAMKRLKKEGRLPDLDESEEINACSVKGKVDVNGVDEDWLLLFKNETHNHPTEIEPFGGAATCLGGAIRDPLSGRAYVYQAMRVTGASDPRVSIGETLSGKLPQKKIVVGAAQGYSSYGNQIGLATGFVKELYHPGYVAKRMEIGAVIGAAPAQNVVREKPANGDLIILIGGRTGRDGCGGATGSSKSHTQDSITNCGAEVQKGNPPEERKIQRLFRNPDVTRLIKRCNDFGAGGVSVAIGELADGLSINLNAIPKKYNGLDGTELAISESQERMAVVVKKEYGTKLIAFANSENLEATVVASVTESPRLRMKWNDRMIVDLSRDFLNSNGAPKLTSVFVKERDLSSIYKITLNGKTVKEKWLNLIGDLNISSQKGLVERFDSTIGAGTVFLPYGGKNQLSESQAMIAKLPVLNGETDTCSLMAYGFNPYLSDKSPFHGGVNAIVSSVAKIIAAGVSMDKMWLTLQEYFPKTKNDPSRWGLPFEALLGAMYAQLKLGVAAIGGKDSMSGSFESIDVPPTLVSFAVSVSSASKVVSTEFKKSGSFVYFFKPKVSDDQTLDFDQLLTLFKKINKLISERKVLSSWALSDGGICEAISKMSFGNEIGFEFDKKFNLNDLSKLYYGGFIIEVIGELEGEELLGKTILEPEIIVGGEKILLSELQNRWESTLESIFPVNIKSEEGKTTEFKYLTRNSSLSTIKIAKPRVVIPVFPGTNCEYDSARAFEKAGAICSTIIINNLTPHSIDESIDLMVRSINNSQIIMLPGGFSGGDEPDGSGKFIATFFRNPKIKEAVENLLNNRDGLILGVCNGFQALIKLGLVPYGEIRGMDDKCPTLTHNTIGRHQSMMVRTKVASVKSPWLKNCNQGDIYTIAISHGEGRFVCSEELLKKLAENGQIATQYVDLDGNPSMDIRYNPNTSMYAIEGITSPDGRVFGKMAHSERIGQNIARNVEGNKDQLIFKSGVDYFR